jgi:hypothetical protein
LRRGLVEQSPFSAAAMQGELQRSRLILAETRWQMNVIFPLDSFMADRFADILCLLCVSCRTLCGSAIACHTNQKAYQGQNDPTVFRI